MSGLSPEAAALKEEGNTAFRAENFSKALDKYRAAIQLAPDNAVLYSNLAAALLSAGDLDGSIEASLKASELDPTWFKPYVRLCTVYEKLGRISKAMEAGEKAIELTPDAAGKATNRKTLDGIRRRNVTIDGSDAVLTSDNLHTHPAFRAKKLAEEGKIKFHPFSEAARVYAAFARVAEVNKILAVAPYQAGLISEMAVACMISGRGFHQQARRVTTNPLEDVQEQLRIEQNITNAIGPNASPSAVIDGYDERRRVGGWSWDKINAALDLSISSSVLNALIRTYLSDKPGDAIDAWQRALDIAEAGAVKWKDAAQTNKSKWLTPPMIRGLQGGVIDGIGRHVGAQMIPETLRRLPDIISIADQVITSINKEAVAENGVYGSLTDYAAFVLQQKAVAYRQKGFVYSKRACMVMMGAATKSPEDPNSHEPLWRDPWFSRMAAAQYIRAAALCSKDDPERANYLFIALSSMCHAGHVTISDIKGIYQLALESIKTAEPLYGDDPHTRQTTTRAAKFIARLDALVQSGKATLRSRLKPFPDPDIQKGTPVDQIVPSVFSDDEDEANWRTPDGLFIEINPIFEEYRKADKHGWVKATIAPKPSPKKARKFGKDDWAPKSYMDVYRKARMEYNGQGGWAIENFGPEGVEYDSESD